MGVIFFDAPPVIDGMGIGRAVIQADRHHVREAREARFGFIRQAAARGHRVQRNGRALFRAGQV